MFLYAGTAMSRKEFTSWQKPRQKKKFFLVIITESLTVLQKINKNKTKMKKKNQILVWEIRDECGKAYSNFTNQSGSQLDMTKVTHGVVIHLLWRQAFMHWALVQGYQMPWPLPLAIEWEEFQRFLWGKSCGMLFVSAIVTEVNGDADPSLVRRGEKKNIF